MADFREEEVRETYEALGWRVVQRKQDKWVLLMFRQFENGTGRGIAAELES
jgi:hypothetical protein